MEEKARELQITALKNGIVIDHIPSEKVFAIVELLKLRGYNEVVTVAINLKSTSLGKKGIIKIEDKVLDESELNKIALLSDHVTINLENVETKFIKQLNEENHEIKYKCFYCERTISEEELELKL